MGIGREAKSDLVDALELNEATNDASKDTSVSMFVTKHEIFMLRRQLGDPQGQKRR